jgi:hypothetical protein
VQVLAGVVVVQAPLPGAPPSTVATATLEHATPAAVQLHIAGQSALVVHAIVWAWHELVPELVVVQPPSSPTAGAPLVVEPLATSPLVPLVAPLELPALPADPPPEHSVDVFATQLNPGPQSELTTQGTSYCGTHVFDVVVTQAPASSTGATPQSSSAAGHFGGATSPGQLVADSVKHTMPVAQSESV